MNPTCLCARQGCKQNTNELAGVLKKNIVFVKKYVSRGDLERVVHTDGIVKESGYVKRRESMYWDSIFEK